MSEARRIVEIADGRRLYTSYARGVAAAFFLVALYTLLIKVPSGEFARDWTHTALHIATGLLALYSGWIADSVMPSKALTLALAFAYGALGLVGWSTDGLLLGSAFPIPLDAADNVFHLALGLGAAATIAVALRRAPPDAAGSKGGARHFALFDQRTRILLVKGLEAKGLIKREHPRSIRIEILTDDQPHDL